MKPWMFLAPVYGTLVLIGWWEFGERYVLGPVLTFHEAYLIDNQGNRLTEVKQRNFNVVLNLTRHRSCPSRFEYTVLDEVGQERLVLHRRGVSFRPRTTTLVVPLTLPLGVKPGSVVLNLAGSHDCNPLDTSFEHGASVTFTYAP
jgi:hypothetical protein